jgi:hypothetical protein
MCIASTIIVSAKLFLYTDCTISVESIVAFAACHTWSNFGTQCEVGIAATIVHRARVDLTASGSISDHLKSIFAVAFMSATKLAIVKMFTSSICTAVVFCIVAGIL